MSPFYGNQEVVGSILTRGPITIMLFTAATYICMEHWFWCLFIMGKGKNYLNIINHFTRTKDIYWRGEKVQYILISKTIYRLLYFSYYVYSGLNHYPSMKSECLPQDCHSSVTEMAHYIVHYYHLHLKSSVPKPDKSTFDENWVFNIIQNYIRASNRVKFRSR